MESDKEHPTKKFRPLASGAISVSSAFVVCLFIICLGFGIYIFILKSLASTNLLAGYFLLNIAYCFKLKQVSIVDITIVAIGFVIRLFIGGYATGIVLSYWIIILTFLLALLLVVGKRRTDVVIFTETGKQMRKSIAGYNLEFLNSIIIIIVTIILFSYIMYTISPLVVLHNGEYLYITSLFVILGLFRYLQAIFVEKKGDSPTNLLIYDRPLQIYIADIMISKPIIAAFDFDGTITTKDTLLDFIGFYVGKIRLIVGLIILSPMLICYKAGLIKNSTAKQKLFSFFFKNVSVNRFNKIGEKYIERINLITRKETIDKIRWHQNQGHQVIIISASVKNWIQPWANQMNINVVLSTEIFVTDNIIDGTFSTKNCYGQEKVNRLLAQYPDRNSYILYAYGDSRGDKELLESADYPTFLEYGL